MYQKFVAGADIYPGFVVQPERIFDEILAAVRWDERLRARETASFGVAYNYSGIVYPDVPMPASLAPMCQRIYEKIGFLPNNCLLNYYPDGQSSMGFHSDSIKNLADRTGVAIVSLGSERKIVFRNKSDRSCEVAYPLPSGSIFYMTQGVQQEWLHAIPKETNAGARISLTFRRIVQGIVDT